MDLDELENTLIRMALTESKARNAKVIQVESIVVLGWPSMKCLFGCGRHGKHFTCPPFAPTPEETRTMLASYREAILVEFSDLTDFADQNIPRQAILDLERAAFLKGCYQALAFAGGPCRLCERCKAEDFQIADRSTMKFCRIGKKSVLPWKARVSMSMLRCAQPVSLWKLLKRKPNPSKALACFCWPNPSNLTFKLLAWSQTKHFLLTYISK